MDIIKAMFIGATVGMIFEYLRYRDGKKILGNIQSFFDGLGMQMANVITLIVAGEAFAKGLTTIGTHSHEFFPLLPLARSWGRGKRNHKGYNIAVHLHKLEKALGSYYKPRALLHYSL